MNGLRILAAAALSVSALNVTGFGQTAPVPILTVDIENVVMYYARADEVLIASARGLGPTQPGVEPGTPFSSAPLQTVNSPLEMTVDGVAVEPLTAIGWPTQENLYRVDFRMPKSAASTATLRLTAAWISGPVFTIPVQ
jgi:uncharacterized protein (TIGR03437 family)